jgi:hypothetical protein
MNGHRVAPCEDLVLRMMTRTQTFPASMPSMGNYGKTKSKEGSQTSLSEGFSGGIDG